jgi:hypothetical protein
MHQGNRLNRLIGVMSLTALAFVFSSAAAQAAPEWTIAGKKITTLEKVLSVKHLILIKVPGVGVELHWTIGHEEKTIHPGGTGDGSMTLSKAVLEGKIPCTVSEPTTIKFKDKLVEHSGAIYDIYELEKVVIKFSGAECPFPKENSFAGPFASLVPSTEAATMPVKEVSEETRKLLNSALGLKLGLLWRAFSAVLESESLLELSGENKGKVWGAQ